MSVEYEWDCETVAVGDSDKYEDGECIDHAHGASYAEVLAWSMRSPASLGERYAIVLVMDDDDGRAWAYMKDGQLPDSFVDAYGHEVRKVPKRFHAEVARSHR